MKKRLLLLPALAFALCGAGACSDSDTDTDAPNGGNAAIEGSVQKGQYVKGSPIVVYRLDETLTATGESYPSQIADDLGRFTIKGRIGSGYLELRATGYYYDENRQTLSDGTLSLQAVASLGQRPINVNLLTTLSFPRIQHLVAAGTPFEKAVRQAEREVLAAFGIGAESLAERFTDMDISKGREADAILLALSCRLQQNRTTAELSALIAEIASEIAPNGSLSESLREKIDAHTSSIDAGRIVRGLLDFYEQMRLDTFEIPPFYRYLDLNGDSEADGDVPFLLFLDPELSSDGFHALPQTGFTGGYRIFASCDFTVDADCDWIEVEKSRLKGGVWSVGYTLSANDGKMRQATLTFRRASDGSLIATRTIRQHSVFQRIYLGDWENGGPRSGTRGVIEAGEEVLLNGRKCVVEFDPEYGPYVDAVKEKRYALCYPIGTVAPCDDIFSCTVTFPASVTGPATTPYYGAIVPVGQSDIPNPSRLNLQVCSGLLRIDLSDPGLKDAASRIELETQTDVFLSGKATYLIYTDQPGFDASYTPADPVFTDRSNRLRVEIPSDGSPCEVCLYPQRYDDLTLKIYDRDERIIRQERLELEVRRGLAYTIRLN